jgi:hypothetical protein
MVGAINPNSSQTFEAQDRAAGKAGIEVAPGEPIPREALSTVSVAPAASSQVSAGTSHHAPQLSNAAIVGIALGGFLVIVLAAGAMFCVTQKAVRKHKETLARSAAPVNHVSPISYDIDYPPPFSPCSLSISEYGALHAYQHAQVGQQQYVSSHL